MIFNVVCSVLQATVALGDIGYQQVLDQALCIPKSAFSLKFLLIKVARELDFSLQNLLVDGHGVVIVEWVDACNHLVSQNAKCPPVHRLTVAFI